MHFTFIPFTESIIRETNNRRAKRGKKTKTNKREREGKTTHDHVSAIFFVPIARIL